VRVVAATNRDLPSLVESGEFREDLYYRLDVFRIELPPLRERRMDIPLLAEAFLARRSPPPPPCSPFTMRILQAYGWSGNVRELFSALESAAIRADGGRIEAQHLPSEIRERSGKASSGPRTEGGRGGGRPSARAPGRYAGALSPDEERAKILAALDETRGNRSQAAELLGMGRTTLWRKMREHGIDLDD
jgi:two-component system response regulator AtoC